jgi:hypothetical protein
MSDESAAQAEKPADAYGQPISAAGPLTQSQRGPIMSKNARLLPASCLDRTRMRSPGAAV